MARKLIVEIIGDSSSLEKSFKKSAVGANNFERSISRTGRGVAAGSGLFRTLGRSLAFASGGFLAAAGAADLIRGAIQQASEGAAAQRQLSAQFKASGQNIEVYRDQIDKATNAVSQLAGFQDDELTRSFTTAFRGSQNVAVGLRIQAIAADVARGRGIDLQAATLALTKAYGGQATALRRLGILVPKQLKGAEALAFVQAKFAGQAAAGTTAQERFTAAFANFEEKIGTALLPTFNKYVNAVAAWLNNTENQEKVQKKVEQGVEVLTTALGLLAGAWNIAAAAVDQYNQAVAKFHSLPGGIQDALRKGFGNALAGVPGAGGLQQLLKLFPRSGGGGVSPIGSQGGRDQPGRSPGGAAAFLALIGGAGGVGGAARTGLAAQFRRSTLALAKAQTTATQADDRRILEQQRKIIIAAIRLTTNLKKRRDLYNQLAGIQNQIAGIDQKAQDARDAAAQKAKDARQKALDAAKRRADAEKAQNQKELALLKAREDRLKTQIKAIQGRFQDQLDAARQGIGDLFAGPVQADVNEAARRTLGLSTGATGVGALTQSLRAQTQQAARFQHDINTLIKRGAPNELIKELRNAGVAGAGTQVHTLATATAAGLKAFLTQFAKREKLALTTTQTIMRSQTVILTADKIRLENLKQDIVIHHTTNLDGRKVAASTSKYQARAQKRTAAQKTGRITGLGPVVG